MSNIYIQEPPTSGKVLLKTSVGDVDVELWSKECPKACRNFIQLCMEGYYDNTIFHRVVKDFIVQGGDPDGDGSGGASIYGEPFKDEFHSRLRYTRRGLVGMANSEKDDNASQFFFTLSATPELQNKNTLFGKITGNTLFNMLKLADGLVDHNERPLYPHKILSTEILSNPFDDIKPRVVEKKVKTDKTTKREKGVKNFGLLSFGEEAEEDEVETNRFVQKTVGKAKSMHDIVDDPTLSKNSIKVEPLNADENMLAGDSYIQVKTELDENDSEKRMERIKERLNIKSLSNRKDTIPINQIKKEEPDSEEDELMTHEEQQKQKSEMKKKEIREEIRSVKKQYQTDKKIRDKLLEDKTDVKPEKDLPKNTEDNEFIKNFLDEKKKYTNLQSKVPCKGTSREEFTLNLLSQFRSKLDALKQKHIDDAGETTVVNDDATVEKDIQGDDWLRHTLKFKDATPVLAKDASTKGDDWYDAYDPRNPINKRKRGELSKHHDQDSAKRTK